MKFDKQLAIILVLVSMLLSAIAISFYFYNQNKKMEKIKNKIVTIYVAKKDLKKDDLIEEKDLKKTTIEKQYILTKPLLKDEIVGKYAKEPIYKNEAFLKVKLKTKVEDETKTEDVTFKYNSYNMKFNLFENPNYSLKPGDIINIVSVYPGNPKEDKTNDYRVQYIAKNIKVIGFIRDGKESNKSIIKKKIEKLVKKKKVEEIVDVKAEEIVLDIKSKTILSLIDDFNKGKQVWMIKSKLGKEVEEKEIKKIVKKKTSSRNKGTRKVYSYPIRWYKPKDTVKTKTALITYANDSRIKDKKEVKISTNFKKICSQTNKLLIAKSYRVSLKASPSNRAKTHRKIKKNYIIPYTSKSKINSDWYRVCDGSYVNKQNVREITINEVNKLRK